VLQKGPNTVLPISQPGNSGALLFDVNHEAIGMIIAGDNNYTYAIKLSNFFNLHKEKSFA
jgi:V8-like Glu-specific endopeptidase